MNTQQGKPQRQPNGHYAVDHLGRQYAPAGNFDFDAHDRHVEAGGCPVVSWTKAWCALKPHARGTDHGSPRAPIGQPGGGWDSWQR